MIKDKFFYLFKYFVFSFFPKKIIKIKLKYLLYDRILIKLTYIKKTINIFYKIKT